MGEAKLRVLSLGAGVQSTTMLLMACEGEIGPIPDAAIFADTGWEPRPVYEHLERLERLVSDIIPVYRVSAGNIREDLAKNRAASSRIATMPLYIARPDQGGTAMIRRQCTKEYKIEPIGKKVRELVKERGLKKRAGVVEQWIGISLDEAIRMKPARVKYIAHRWPLIEQRMTRHDCLRWLERKGFTPPPKSSCVGCPFHDDGFWREMKMSRPDEFADAVAFDRQIRHMPRLTHPTYLHRSLLPLDEVDFSNAEDRGQGNLFDGFSGECEGMCGV